MYIQTAIPCLLFQPGSCFVVQQVPPAGLTLSENFQTVASTGYLHSSGIF